MLGCHHYHCPGIARVVEGKAEQGRMGYQAVAGNSLSLSLLPSLMAPPHPSVDPGLIKIKPGLRAKLAAW